MKVFDASALLAFLQDEPGADLVESELTAGPSVCNAVTWSETAQKIMQRGGNWEVARSVILSFGLEIEPVGIADAEAAAFRWQAPERHLSLGDRLCLATGARLGATVVTADKAWGESDSIKQVR